MTLYNDEHIPALLVQTKVDLLPDENQDNTDELNNFSQKNGFIGCFRTSAKTGKNISKPTYEERINMCYHHLEYLLKIKPERVAVLEMRSHIAWYIKGLPNSIDVKNEVFKANSLVEIRNILQKYLNKLIS